MSNPNKLFTADYEVLRKAIKDNTVNGIKDWLENPNNRNQGYIKSTLIKLISVENNDYSSKGKGRKPKDDEISNDRYYSYNEIERIISLCTFKTKDIISVINIIRMIEKRLESIIITTEKNNSGTAIKEYVEDHSYSLGSSGKTRGKKYEINDILDLAKDELFRLHTALFISRHSEPLVVPAWLIMEKIKARSEEPRSFLEADDLIMHYDTSAQIIDEPLVWTFIRAIKNKKDISVTYRENKSDYSDSPKEVVFNNSNGRIFLRFSSDPNLIGLDSISGIKTIDRSNEPKAEDEESGSSKTYLSFDNTGLSLEQLQEMFPKEDIIYNEDGSFKVSCKNHKEMKAFIRRYYKGFIPDDKKICDELKNDCIEALKNYGVDI